MWALDRARGKVVWRAPLPAASIAPVAVSGDTLLTAGGVPIRGRERTQIVAYRLADAARGAD